MVTAIAIFEIVKHFIVIPAVACACWWCRKRRNNE